MSKSGGCLHLPDSEAFTEWARRDQRQVARLQIRENTMSVNFRMTSQARGSCSHRHLTIAGAAECAFRYERDCEKQGIYTDRRLVVRDGDEEREPTPEESREFAGRLQNIQADRIKPKKVARTLR